MPTRAFQLAQLNVARPREPVGSDLLREFVEQLVPVNALADAAPGFVWRLQTEAGDATALRGVGDDSLMINMSVWTSLEALRDFVYSSPAHLAVMRRRREWFERLGEQFLVLWWVTAGHRPTLAEAQERLEILREEGPTPKAFTFRASFPAPDDAGDPTLMSTDARELCPA